MTSNSHKEEEEQKKLLLSQLRQVVLARYEKEYPPPVLNSNNSNGTPSQQGEDQDSVAVQKHLLLQDTAQLHRILVARQFHIDKAADLVMEQVRFRVKWNPRQITPNMIPNALSSGALRICGYSKQGHVVVNFKLRLWDPSVYGIKPQPQQREQQQQLDENQVATSANAPVVDDEDNSIDDELQVAVDEFVRYVIYMLELSLDCIAQSSSSTTTTDRLMVLFDLRGFSMSMVFSTRVRRMISRLIYVAQAQYPERLERVYLLHAPFGFATAWQMVRPLLDVRTANKIHFLSSTEQQSSLLELMDDSVLSQDYGGQHAEYPLLPPTMTTMTAQTTRA